MRLGVFWCAAAVTLLACCEGFTSPTVEGKTRLRPSRPIVSSLNDSNLTSEPTFKPRSSRQQENLSHDVQRIRTRNKPRSQTEEPSSTEKQLNTETPKRNYLRVRTKPIAKESSSETIPYRRTTNLNRIKTKQSLRQLSAPTTNIDVESSSKSTETNKPEFNEAPLFTTTKNDYPSTQFRRRSSSAEPENITPKILRSRFNAKGLGRIKDQNDAGTTNVISIVEKPTTSRTYDLKNSRKLRYRSRLSEPNINSTNSNISINSTKKSSQLMETFTSQNPDISAEPTTATANNPINIQSSTEASTTSQSSTKTPNSPLLPKIANRPRARGKINYKPSENVGKTIEKDEVSEDDNYPESFKALLQAKSAETQASSSSSESLSLKASEKVYNTFTSTSTPTNTSDTSTKHTRLRSKSSQDEKDTNRKPNDSTPRSRTSASKTFDYNPRGNLSTRTRKTYNFTSTTPIPFNKRQYKSNRKLKLNTSDNLSTTEGKSLINDKPKRNFNRTSYYSRKATTTSINNTSTTTPNTPKIIKSSLPRTTHYAKTRNQSNVEVTSTTIKPPVIPIETKNKEYSEDMPLIFTLLRDPTNDISEDNSSDKPEEIFVIAVSSKENLENSTNNEISQEISFKPIVESITSKYHASYKEPNPLTEKSPKEIINATPSTLSIRNLQTRKHSRPSPEVSKSIETSSTFKPRNLRKYHESNNKYEVPFNGITTNSEKQKTRFSSKYRAPYTDKQSYKPTVPTVTPSTAWLKFYVTDQQLTKFMQEPIWFEDEDIFDVTTEPMSRLNITPQIIYEPSFELAVGEEIQLGTDIHAISITKTRSKLSSADLKLSESEIKSSQVMNVEATINSPSVTVSIFDALADILTSTPKFRISTTTDVTPIAKSDNKQKLRGVSKVVNKTQELNENKINKDVNDTDNKTTDKKLANINERTLSSNSEDIVITPVNNRFTIPALISTTPVSFRKPFAVKILYSEKETDDSNTISESLKPTTDIPSTVYNTSSDLFSLKSNFISSELTSMLSNNIMNIIQSMDEQTKSKISLENMQHFLKNLVPRAIDENVATNNNLEENINTTPYSLEDIQDTAIINVNTDTKLSASDKELFQSINISDNVNTNLSDINFLNNSVNNMNQTDIFETSTLKLPLLDSTGSSTSESSSSQSAKIDSTDISNKNTLSDDNISVDIKMDDTIETTTQITNKNIPIPFFTNAQKSDFVPSNPLTSLNDFINEATTELITPKPQVTSTTLSPLEIFILTKKAAVLEMIENLIKQHQTDISNLPSLTANDPSSSNIPFTNRLTEIMETMTSSTLNPVQNFSPSTTKTDLTVLFSDKTSNTGIVDTTEPISLNDISSTTMGETKPSKSDSLLDAQTTVTTSNPSQENTFSPSTLENIDTTLNSNIESTTVNENNFEDVDNIGTTTAQTKLQLTKPKKDYVIFGILPNNTVVRKDPNDDALETLTESTPYVIYSLLPNNTIIRRFPNGTRIPRVMQKIDILPISPGSLRNPYNPIHNNPEIVRPKFTQIQDSTNSVTPAQNFNNGKKLTDSVNNLQLMMTSSARNMKNSDSLGISTTTKSLPIEKSTASHVLSLRTTTILPSIDEILLNSLSAAAIEEKVIASMTTSTHEPRILTLDIDPETKQIRTEKPNGNDGKSIFKYIPIDEIKVSPKESNVLKISSKSPIAVNLPIIETQTTGTESNTQISQIDNNVENTETPTTTTLETMIFTSMPLEPDTVSAVTTEFSQVDTEDTDKKNILTTSVPTMTFKSEFSTPPITFTPETTTKQLTTTLSTPSSTEPTTIPSSLLPLTTTDFNKLMDLSNLPISTTTDTPLSDISTNINDYLKNYEEEAKLIEKLLTNTNSLVDNKKEPTPIPILNNPETNSYETPYSPSLKTNTKNSMKINTFEEDIKQFEEDTKLLKALLKATGQNPANFNIPTLDSIQNTKSLVTTTIDNLETATVAPSLSNDEANEFIDDTKLLQSLLKATSKETDNKPIISGLTSNVRLSSNSISTSTQKELTTSRPASTSTDLTYTNKPTVFPPISTLQPSEPSYTEGFGISTTLLPSGRKAPTSRISITTEVPSSSTFSDAEDLMFLQNLKSVLKTNNKNEDPETSLANRIVALAVERTLDDITASNRTGKEFVDFTTTKPTTTPKPTTTTEQYTPSIEEDIKQFQEDTKLLQALLKATGQDPSKLNIPTLTSPNSNVKINLNSIQSSSSDLNLLSNLLSTPSSLTREYDTTTNKVIEKPVYRQRMTTPQPYGTRIVIKDDAKNVQDDGKLLQTLKQLQDVQESTTLRSRLTITGQSSDEALKKLIQKSKQPGMVPEATKSSLALSTEYGKSNDALLAALLKEQGFGPTTASSLDEQQRLAALLNQVVVTPKFRTTTLPPPPPAQRRPIIDGLAWLWQQWRETGPGPSGATKPRRPTSSAATSGGTVSWFGSGPFVGNADERPSSNRIPLDPPRAVTSQQEPGRGQLVSAAINVTRAFSQFLGAAFQGAAKTMQNVIRAGQRGAAEVFTGGSGGARG